MNQQSPRQSTSSKFMFPLFVCLILVMVGAGAKDMTQDILFKDNARNNAFNRCLTRWTDQIMSEVPAEDRDNWRELARKNPRILIKACAVEKHESPLTSSTTEDY